MKYLTLFFYKNGITNGMQFLLNVCVKLLIFLRVSI